VVTVNGKPLLANPLTVTTTLPVVAPLGTVTPILLAPQLVTGAAVPLNVTVLPLWVAPKLDPEMVTGVPTSPEVTERLAIVGTTIIVKFTPLLATPPTVTTTLPVVAPLGTVTPMLVAVHPVTVAAVLLNVTVLVPLLDPKLLPAIVTAVPTGPEVGDRLAMEGAIVSVKLTPLLAIPPTVTTTLPVVAPAGTVTAMLVELQLVGVAAVPLKVTVLPPWLDPKLTPEMVTVEPIGPDAGARPEMEGATVKLLPLLVRPPTVTTTLPVVAPLGTVTAMLVGLQLVGVAAVPLKVTVLPFGLDPKLSPEMVTAEPIEPDAGARSKIVGATARIT
jgi:hypothetical protein